MPKSVFTDAYTSLRETLIALRKEAGVSQVELGLRLGKQQTWISQIERGVRRVDLIEFYALTKALGIDPEAAFSRVVRQLPPGVEI